MLNNLFRSIRVRDFQDSFIMTGGTLLAGVFDYAFNVISGRLLLPSEYSILVAMLSILQILLHATNVIRNVVAYYTADIVSKATDRMAITPFLRQSYRWSWRWGIVSAILLGLLAFPLSAWLNFPSPAPVWAAAPALIMLFVRPITDGTLQGIQQFRGLASVAVFQAVLRVLAGFLLIQLLGRAVGAVIALPIATFAAFGLAMWFLQDYFRGDGSGDGQSISLRYSMETFIGFISYAILTNADVLFTRAYFPTSEAATYAAVATLGKIILFISLAIGMTLFPKAISRYQSGEPVAPLLFLALGGTFLPGLAMTGIYFAIPDLIVEVIFRNEFQSPGIILGLVGLATTLFAGINIWLNYALSTKREWYVYTLLVVVIVYLLGLFYFQQSLQQFAMVLITAGVLGNLLGVGLLGWGNEIGR
ncbi:MAG: hypothetical protein AAF633_03380 [Chloroflexota bacterium]